MCSCSHIASMVRPYMRKVALKSSIVVGCISESISTKDPPQKAVSDFTIPASGLRSGLTGTWAKICSKRLAACFVLSDAVVSISLVVLHHITSLIRDCEQCRKKSTFDVHIQGSVILERCSPGLPAPRVSRQTVVLAHNCKNCL